MKELLVQTIEEETEVALLEEGRLAEYYLERSSNQRLVGNIFKGRVENVLPGMQAAFVNIGLEKNAFLYAGDAAPPRTVAEDGELQSGETRLQIQDAVKAGQELLVQIAKEPVGVKGARITTNVTLPGRYLVLMPTVDYIGVSRRIESESERERLKDLALSIKPPGMGLIIRTVAENLTAGELEQDVKGLLTLWQKIQAKLDKAVAPALVHSDFELALRIVRDLLTADIERMWVNNVYVYEKLLEAVDLLAPGLKAKIKLREADLFAEYAVEQEIQKALKKKVWLKSGGYLVIDQTEALTAIDVNTGKYVGVNSLEETILNINLEAAVEIARQLRLRNIGGIIIIDFIDMQLPEHQASVLKALEQECKRDRVKTNILGLTQLGLVEMTRKKMRQSLESVMTRNCPYCDGYGKVASEETVALRVKKELLEKAGYSEAPGFLVEAHPLVAALLIGSGGQSLEKLERQAGKTIVVKGCDHLHVTKYEVRALYSEQEFAAQSPLTVGQILELTVSEPHSVNPQTGIGRVNGFVVNVEDGGAHVGEQVTVEVTKVQRTSATAKLIL